MVKAKRSETTGSPARPKTRTHKRAAAMAPAAAKPRSPYVAATGRRKTAVARVRLTPAANPEFVLNGRSLPAYFPQADLQQLVVAPLSAVGKDRELSVSVKVSGGGTYGQAVAVQHGIARALLKIDATFRPTLKPHGYLTRDPRMKERKKPGLLRARRAPQWAKR